MALQDTFKQWSPRLGFGVVPPMQADFYKPRPVLLCCGFTVLFSLVLGGGTRGGFLSDAVLQLLAIPALLMSVAGLTELSRGSAVCRWRIHMLLACCLAVAALPLFQLIPLPPWIWTNLPAREEIVAVYDLLGRGRPWMPISVTPNATWLGMLSLLAPTAVFLAAVQLTFWERRLVTLGIIACGAGSVVLGLAQLAQGPTSWLRFFTVTNADDAVGFFANRNHFAAFLYCVLVFAAAWGIDIVYRIGSWRALKNFVLSPGIPFLAIAAVFVALLVGEAFVRSRAGLILTIVALTGILPLALADRRQANTSQDPGRQGSGKQDSAKFVVAATLFVIVIVVQFALYRIMNRYATDALHDARLTLAGNTFAAAKAFLPFGSGIGSFVQVYGMFEKPSDLFVNTFANHAHNDFLELFLETGGIGAAFTAGFLAWLGSAALAAWRQAARPAGLLDRTLARAASIVIILLLVHSFVDYPLRTNAIMAIFAFSCAMLVRPVAAEPSEGGEEPGSEQHARRHADAEEPPLVGDQAKPSAAAAASPVASPVAQPARSWGEDIEWPDAWRR